jgi:hypothetical protein
MMSPFRNRIFGIFLPIIIFYAQSIFSVSHPFYTKSNEFCYDENDEECGKIIIIKLLLQYDQVNCLIFKSKGPSNWPGICTTGQRQSPIDIDFTSENSLQGSIGFTNMRFNADYASTHRHFYTRSTGHSCKCH